MARKATSSSGRSSRGSGKTSTDHDEIRQWAEARGGKPACVKGTGGKNDTGLLRIDFPGYSGQDSLQPITWDEFFDKFEEQKLALAYQDRTSKGEESRFNKLVSRTTARRKPDSTRAAQRDGRAASHKRARKTSHSTKTSGTKTSSRTSSRTSAASASSRRQRSK